jgi:hypothetical protein
VAPSTPTVAATATPAGVTAAAPARTRNPFEPGRIPKGLQLATADSSSEKVLIGVSGMDSFSPDFTYVLKGVDGQMVVVYADDNPAFRKLVELGGSMDNATRPGMELRRRDMGGTSRVTWLEGKYGVLVVGSGIDTQTLDLVVAGLSGSE